MNESTEANDKDKVKILVVDDQEKNIIAMKSILSDLDIQIFTASSGEEAIKHVLHNSFAVIFLDVQMPGMDGYEVARCLKGNKRTAGAPIVFVTAIYDSIENIKQGYKVGAADYLTKPVDQEVLLAKAQIFITLYNQQRELETVVAELERVALNDALTGLSNRHQLNLIFDQVLESAKRSKKLFALLFLDLDNFKWVNDTHGHDVGDKLLIHTARALESAVRKSDFVARLGGDEFAVLLTNLSSADDSSAIASNLIAKISKPFSVQSTVLKTSMSIGIAMFPFAGSSVQQLFKSADIALYRSKSKGKNTYTYFSKQLNQIHERRASIEKAFHEALDSEQIYLRYQPRYQLANGELSGFEVLARWEDQDLGVIPPSEFINIAEETNFILQLGLHLLDSAFKEIDQCLQINRELGIYFAINLSPYQLNERHFVKQIELLLERYSILPDTIEFKLTESIFTAKFSEIEKAILKLSEMGFKFSIDDFGTGYASLSRLKALPINAVKIDKSFIQELAAGEGNVPIIKAIVALADSLNIKTVAEGIELVKQQQLLVASGCTEGQGGFFSPPISMTDVLVMLSDKS